MHRYVHIYIYIYTVKYGQNNEQCMQNISQLEKTTYMYYNVYIFIVCFLTSFVFNYFVDMFEFVKEI